MTRHILAAVLMVVGALTSVRVVEPAVASNNVEHVFYVAANGKDEWSGQLEAPVAAGTDGPFTTLTRARDAVRQLKYQNGGQLDQPVNVLVRGGTYRFTEPLRLSGGDSGTLRCPVTYAAFPGETPVLSGGRIVDDWQPYQGQILQTSLPQVREDRLWFRQLFYNGQRMTRARWPNDDHGDPLYGGWAFIEKVISPNGGPPIAFQFEQDVFPHRWSNPTQAEVFVIPGKCWFSDSIRIRHVDWQQRIIHLTRPVGPSRNTLGLATHLLAGNRFYVENNLEDLTGPGQWCLDAEQGILYFWPPDDGLARAEVTVPVTDRIVQMIGQVDEPVAHVKFRGFTFTQTQVQWPTPESYYKTPNAGQTVYLEYAADCALENNHFLVVGGDAIRLQNRNARIAITGNHIEQAGAYGVFVGAYQRGYDLYDTFSGDLPRPPVWHRDLSVREVAVKAWPESREHLIHNNHIHHVGVYEKHAAGVSFFGVRAVDVTVSHNLIHHTPRFGIGMMSGLGRIIIEYNDLHNLSLETADTGAITANRWYTYDKDPELARGNIIRFNRIYDCVGSGAYGKRQVPGSTGKYGDRIWVPYYSWAIYFDNAPMDVRVYGNICARNTLGGIMISHYCKNVTVENNIFVDSDESQVYLALRGQVRNVRFARNIFYYSHPNANYVRLNTPSTLDLTSVLAEFDNNLIYHAGGTTPTFHGGLGEAARRLGVTDPARATFDKWRKLGYDDGSTVADPKFLDVKNDNYALQPDSPALRLGFEPIDMQRIGLLRD